MNNDRNDRPSINPRRSVFDVVRPGRTPASPTSRPVVSSQKPVQDTSVTVGAPPVPRGLMDQKPSVAPMAPVSTPVAKPTPAPSFVSRPMGHAPVQPRPFVPSSHHPQPLQAQQEVGEVAAHGQVTRPEGADELPQHPAAHHQRHSMLSEILAIVAILVLIAVIVNILVDADVIDLPIPHTNFFEY